MGLVAHVDRYGVRTVRVQQATLTLSIGRLPPQKAYTVYIFPIPEYILEMDVVKDLRIATTQCEFLLLVHVVTPITTGHPHHTAVQLLNPHQVVQV